MIPSRASLIAGLAIVIVAAVVVSSVHARTLSGPAATAVSTTTIQVSGSGMDHLDTAVVHSQENTATGMIQHGTEIVDLTGDLRGRVLYQVTSVFDFVHGTLVNTGEEIFSGTIAGSPPVMIHDDQFRFDVNLVTGVESGQVYLFDHVAGPKVRCQLSVVGTGLDAAGNPTFTYTGACTFRGE